MDCLSAAVVVVSVSSSSTFCFLTFLDSFYGRRCLVCLIIEDTYSCVEACVCGYGDGRVMLMQLVVTRPMKSFLLTFLRLYDLTCPAQWVAIVSLTHVGLMYVTVNLLGLNAAHAPFISKVVRL